MKEIEGRIQGNAEVMKMNGRPLVIFNLNTNGLIVCCAIWAGEDTAEYLYQGREVWLAGIISRDQDEEKRYTCTSPFRFYVHSVKWRYDARAKQKRLRSGGVAKSAVSKFPF